MSKISMRNAEYGIRNLRSKTWIVERAGCIPHSPFRIPHSWQMLMLLLLFSILPASAHAISGREVFEKVHEVSLKSLDHKIEMTMVLFDKGGGKRTRSLTSYSKNADPEAYKALAVFNTPPDLKNVGFLVHAHTFSERDLWAYFPEYKRVRRIANTSQDDSFFGSDLSYDDFTGPPNLDDFKFTHSERRGIGRETVLCRRSDAENTP